MQTLVLFDIGDDRLRGRVEAACRDAGFERTQFSAFLGDIGPDRRERLTERLRALVDRHTENEAEDDKKRALTILIVPVCAADFAAAVNLTRADTAPATPHITPDFIII